MSADVARNPSGRVTAATTVTRQRVALVTNVDFAFPVRDAARARILKMAEYLAAHADLMVIYLGRNPEFNRNLERLGFRIRVANLPVAHASRPQPRVAAALRRFLAEQAFDRVVVEYVFLHWVADLLPSRTVSILDTHNVLFQRAAAFAAHGRQAPIIVDEATELRLFRKFDHVAFIQAEEHAYGVRHLGAERALLCPHAVELAPPVVREIARRVGFMASGGLATVDGLIWFHDQVWPRVTAPGARAVVAGTIGNNKAITAQVPCIEMAGQVAELGTFYQTLDVAACPVLYGAGLKIKVVESLAHGLPLVTTSTGAQGIIDAAGEAFLLAEDHESFAGALDGLLGDVTARRRLSAAAQDLVRARFTAHICYRPLLG